MMVPGLIAYHLYGPSLASIDLAYPTLVRNVLPNYLTGFFLAVLLGAVFSSFNSLLNSAATMFILDVYVPLKKTQPNTQQLLKSAKIASILLALVSFIIAPLLQFAPSGLWELIRIFTGFYNVPIIAVVLIGLLTKRVPPLAAKTAIIFHLFVYGAYRFLFEWDIHYVHMYAVLFGIEVAIMLTIGKLRPLDQPRNLTISSKRVDMTPWKFSLPMSSTLLMMIILLYIVFSPLGLVGGLSGYFWPLVIGVILLNGGFCFWVLKTRP